jgi:hypothetical protein
MATEKRARPTKAQAQKNTSIDLPPELHLRARLQAVKDGTTLRELIIEGLELVLAKRSAR